MGVVGLLALAATPGCAAEEEDTDGSGDAISKPELRGRLTDLRNITTRQFGDAVFDATSGALSNALRVKSKYGELGITIEPANVFGVQEETSSVLPEGAKVKSLTAIRQGLAQDLGEKELPTELAALRLKHLASGAGDKYYVETGWGMRGAIGPQLSHEAGGFGDNDSKLTIGFRKGKNLSARVVVATPDAKLRDLIDVSGEAIATLREGYGGFVVPENAEQILKMKPGESFGLKGEGTFAANFGVTAPFLVADVGPFAYSLAVSAGLSHTVSGEMDVQLVRLDGDEVALDVGMRDGQVDARSFGITGNWGFPNQCGDGDCLTGITRTIVKKALVKRVSEFMKTSVGVSAGENVQRLELARMRFHLSQPETAKALEFALHGDLRYAQALYAKNLQESNPPVMFDFDMLRASMTSNRTFGAKVFGIDVYHKVAVEKSGSFAVQTPNGVQSVLWDSFKKESGWFQMNHGSKLTAISSSAINADSPDKAVNQANFIVQSVVGDQEMDDDVLLDSTDALIATLAGKDALEALNKFGTPMQQAIGEKCPIVRVERPGEATDKDTWDEACNVRYLEQDSEKIVNVDGKAYTLSEARAAGVEAFMAQPAVRSLPREYTTDRPDPADATKTLPSLMKAAAGLRLTLQMVKINAVQADGPGVSFALSYRLDDEALRRLAQVNDNAFSEAVTRYFSVVGGERVGVRGGKSISDDKAAGAASEMLKAFTQFKASFRNVAENESQDIPRLPNGSQYTKLPIGIRFDLANVRDYGSPERLQRFAEEGERLRIESLSHQRALLGKVLFDGLAKAADSKISFGNSKGRLFQEQAAAYPLIALLPAPNLEVGLDLAANSRNSFFSKTGERFKKAGFDAVAVSARGSDVDPITSKLFDIDKMLNAP